MRLRANLPLVMLLLFSVWSVCPVPLVEPSTASLPMPTAGVPRPAAQPATYYVRPDGGSAIQCTGLVDALYPGSGSGQPCAWDHPFRALPPGGPPRMAGGDTLIIAAGDYMMGLGAPGADNTQVCYPNWSWGCRMPPVPSGPNPSHPTRILGAGWDSGCADPPQLWGTERAWSILDLSDASNVEVGCLELTDHSGCIEFHTGGLACERGDNPPFGSWAPNGLYAEDSANVYLHDLDIHGFASAGVRAGRLTDWTVENVRIAGNGLIGWEGDIYGDDANSGTLLFRRWRVEWNGCGEAYPGGEMAGCWGQNAGGYGDGVGTGRTGGHWIIEDSAFMHNTSDGLDLLYVQVPGSSIEIRRSIAAGNAGNQIKTAGPVRIENTVMVSDCSFFEGRPGWNRGDSCRAGGDTLAIALLPGDRAELSNSTLTGQGICLMITSCAWGQICDGSEQVVLRNNIFQGHRRFLQPDEDACFAWYDNEHLPTEGRLPNNPFSVDYNLMNGVHFGNVRPCPGGHNMCGAAPGLFDTSLEAFDAHLLAGSLAVDAGSADGAPGHDFDGRPRDAVPDLGAYEWRAPMAWIYLPLVTW